MFKSSHRSLSAHLALLGSSVAGVAGKGLVLGLVATGLVLGACTRNAGTATPVAPASFVRTPQQAPAPQVDSPAATIRVTDLPRQGQITYQAILAGGPFAFDKDGSVFGNRERALPGKPRGYYREYTVAPAHARNRGAKRIVCGGAPRTPDVCYYTSDHYNSFRMIVNP